MAHIIYPTIDLFLYDLRDALGQNPEQVKQNRNQFVQKLPASLHSCILENEDQFEAEFIELLGETRTEHLTLNSKDFEGYYYPVLLSDTYGLLLDCSVVNQTKPYPVSCIGKLKELVDQSLNHQVANLGQSWLISGQLPGDTYPNETPETIARECYQALIPKADWEKSFQGTSLFLGGIIFELWRYNFNLAETSTTPSSEPLPLAKIEDNHHVIIALYPDEATASKAAEFIDDWMRLFCYRDKIIWAYNQSRILKKYLKKDFIDIQNYIRLLRKEDTRKIPLKRLQENLDKAENIFSHYAIDLEYLDYQANTIEINLHNYWQRLEIIQKNLASPKSQNDLEFLKKFSHQAQEKYLRQLQKDYHNLSKGLKLLETAVNFIRAEVEVDKSARDRNFQNTVAIVGVGLAAGSAVISMADKIPSVKQAASKQSPDWSAFALTASSGLGAAVIAAVLTWLVICLWPRSR